MGSRWVALVVLSSVAAFAACSDDDAPPYGVLDDLADNFGLHIDGYQTVVDQYEEDGYIVTLVEGQTWIDDAPPRTMAIRQEQFSAAEGGDIVLNITDVATGVSRYFLYNFDESFIVFGEDSARDESRGVGVQRNPDDTYEVWSFDDQVSDRTDVRVVPDGYAAKRFVEAFNGFADIDPHIILTAFALGHSETPEARCPPSNFFGGAPQTAAAPVVVCSIFKAFCDCVACRALARGGACPLCPQL